MYRECLLLTLQEPSLRILSFKAAMGSGVAATMEEAAKT